MKKKYYALLVDGKIEKGAWEGEYIIYSSKRYVKKSLQYWTNPDNFRKVPKCRIVEIHIGKEIKL